MLFKIFQYLGFLLYLSGIVVGFPMCNLYFELIVIQFSLLSFDLHA